MKIRLLLVSIAVLCVSISPAFAGIYDTGQAGVGNADTMYTLSTGTAMGVAETLPWVAPTDAGTFWIGPSPFADTDPVMAYNYTLDPIVVAPGTVATLTGQWASDNNGQISVDGGSGIFTRGNTDYDQLLAFSIELEAGSHTLVFETNNIAGVPGAHNPTGILVTGTAIATRIVPVPAAFLLGVFGLGAAGIKLRKFA